VRGAEPGLLLTMLTEGGERSRSHGIRRELLEQQAAAVGVPFAFASATWPDYEAAFLELSRQAVAAGLRVGVFGDIDIQRHRDWVESICSAAGSTAYLPLWRRDRSSLMRDLLEAGFRAVLVGVKDGSLPSTLLGETIDHAMLRTFERAGVDLAGENGEYHTFVVDGPILRRPVEVEPGEVVLRDGVWFVDLVAS
jgi:uncharacterized protein (TIGR00290 family)